MTVWRRWRCRDGPVTTLGKSETRPEEWNPPGRPRSSEVAAPSRESVVHNVVEDRTELVRESEVQRLLEVGRLRLQLEQPLLVAQVSPDRKTWSRTLEYEAPTFRLSPRVIRKLQVSAQRHIVLRPIVKVGRSGQSDGGVPPRLSLREIQCERLFATDFLRFSKEVTSKYSRYTGPIS